MIRDHFLPSYLEALDTVQGSLRAYLEGSNRPEEFIDPMPEFCKRLKKTY
jgi:small basic protein